MEKDIIQTTICHTDDLSEDIRKKLKETPGQVCYTEDSIYLQLDRKVWRFQNDPAGKELAFAVHRLRSGNQQAADGTAELYDKILNDVHYRPDPSALKQYGINPDRKRCAVVFRSYSPLENDLCSIIVTMVPMETADTAIPLDYQTALYIKDQEGCPEEEMKEFTEAVIGTMESEGITDIRAGISRGCAGIDGIRTGYDEAMKALELGVRYHSDGHVFVYSEQMLERIVDAIPEQKKEMLRQAFFGSCPSNTLSDEMIETVRVFFRNDLNLTAASKQLFIHRNTLNYRLDKIRKDFGLDLRSFRDAVIFRIMSEIASETPSETKS